MTPVVNQREIVLDILLEISKRGEMSHVVLRRALEKYQYLDKQERSFITIVTEGTIENRIRIDYVLDQFSKVKTGKMKKVVLEILRLSVYQMLFMKSIPDAAVCNEAVKLASKRGFAQLKGFVNGVLRAIGRNKEKIVYPDASKNLLKSLSIEYSMPEWIVEQWIYQYGTEEAARMLKGVAKPDVRISARCNLSRISVEECEEKLRAEGVTVERNPYIPEAFYLSDFDYLGRLRAFRDGDFAVQDLSSMFVAKTADPKKGAVCIDVCAAPGGKSMHLADLLCGTGSVEARDISDYKVDLIRENIRRMGFQNVKAVVRDAFEEDVQAKETADCVIADLPCSGLGVMGKKSDIKYHMTPEKQKELIKVQRRILKNAVSLLKPEGKLIFSTCTTNREENYGNFRWISEELHLKPDDISSYFPKEFGLDTAKDGYVQLLPGIHKCDGFFISRFTK